MATTPIYGEPIIYFLQNQMADELGPRCVAFGMWVLYTKFCSNDDPRLNLTYFKARSNSNPNAFTRSHRYFEKPLNLL